MTQSPRFRSSSLLGMHILGTRVLRAPTVPAAPSPRRLTLPATPSSQNPEPQPLPQRGPKGLPGKGGGHGWGGGGQGAPQGGSGPQRRGGLCHTAIPLRALLSAANSPVRAGRQKLSGPYSQSCPKRTGGRAHRAPAVTQARDLCADIVETIPLAATLGNGGK